MPHFVSIRWRARRALGKLSGGIGDSEIDDPLTGEQAV